MLVDATKYPSPALWQGLMLIGLAIWAPWLFSIGYTESVKPPFIFIGVWFVFASWLTWYVA